MSVAPGTAGVGQDVGVDANVLPVLYSFRRCPYAMRARLALAASGQQCELREVVLRDKPAGLIAASPKATVPVLVLPDGKVIDQSLDIMHWALAEHDPEGWLLPSAEDRSVTEALIAECDGRFKRHLDRYKYPNRYVAPADAGMPRDADSEQVPMHADAAELGPFALAHRTAGAAFIWVLNTRLGGAGPAGAEETGDEVGNQAANQAASADAHDRAKKGPYLFGSRWSLADAAMLPFIRQFAATDPAWFDAQAWTAVHAWLSAFVASPRYAAVMDKYPRWQDGTPGLRFPG